MAEHPHYKDQLKDEKSVALYIAMVVRKAMEDFHAKHLSDAQMKELSPIIRNAIYTALHALSLAKRSLMAKRYVGFQLQLIPDYWEEPQLLEDFSAISAHRSGGDNFSG
jgi:hypothetical protein